MKSPEGEKAMKEYFHKLYEREQIKIARAEKLLQRYGVCDDSTFDYLMLDILEKQEKYDARHYDTYTDRPLHIMNLMWEIASLKGVEIEPIDGLTESKRTTGTLGNNRYIVQYESALNSGELIYPGKTGKNSNAQTVEVKITQEKPTSSLADELKKLKDLLDSGVLSKEEFDEAKKKLLSKY